MKLKIVTFATILIFALGINLAFAGEDHDEDRNLGQAVIDNGNSIQSMMLEIASLKVQLQAAQQAPVPIASIGAKVLSNGVPIGTFINSTVGFQLNSDNYVTVLTPAGVKIDIATNTGKVKPLTLVSEVFTSTNCTGQGYIFSLNAKAVGDIAIGIDGTLYETHANDVRMDRYDMSYRAADGSCFMRNIPALMPRAQPAYPTQASYALPITVTVQ